VRRGDRAKGWPQGLPVTRTFGPKLSQFPEFLSQIAVSEISQPAYRRVLTGKRRPTTHKSNRDAAVQSAAHFAAVERPTKRGAQRCMMASVTPDKWTCAPWRRERSSSARGSTRRASWRVLLLLALFAPEACAQSSRPSSPLPLERIAVIAVPTASVDSLTLQAAAQLRERLANSTASNALRVTPKSDVDLTFTQEGPATLSAANYQQIAFLTRSTVLTLTASRQAHAVRVRSWLYTARDSVGRVMPVATGRTASEAVDQLAGQLERMPRSKLFPAP
jgi:hypothetical protein